MGSGGEGRDPPHIVGVTQSKERSPPARDHSPITIEDQNYVPPALPHAANRRGWGRSRNRSARRERLGRMEEEEQRMRRSRWEKLRQETLDLMDNE